jgi:putative endonuclease
MNDWYVYVLECADGSLYTGCTNDLNRRIGEHQKGTASKYTATRLPVEFKWAVMVPEGKGAALKLEHHLKSKSRAEKLEIIGG